MTHAIRFHKTGGPEVLVWEEVEVGKPGPGEARIRHTAVGLNFVDIYNRSGALSRRNCRAAWAAKRPAWSRKSAPA